jgi:predicted O-methyltransferase YrrM
MKLEELIAFTRAPDRIDAVDAVWTALEREFIGHHADMPKDQAMPRAELSFHQHVRLLGFLALAAERVSGDMVEIGVWKGKSLALMSRLAAPGKRVIGVDPLELKGQKFEANWFRERIFPEVTVIQGYAEHSIREVLKLSQRLSLLHIDGGHFARNVLLDFLLYGELISPGGFIVFDDYRDYLYSPEVGPAVDLLRVGGFFEKFNILGSVPGFENSYVIQRLGS